jgi:hypothetical protein
LINSFLGLSAVLGVAVTGVWLALFDVSSSGIRRKQAADKIGYAL